MACCICPGAPPPCTNSAACSCTGSSGGCGLALPWHHHELHARMTLARPCSGSTALQCAGNTKDLCSFREQAVGRPCSSARASSSGISGLSEASRKGTLSNLLQELTNLQGAPLASQASTPRSRRSYQGIRQHNRCNRRRRGSRPHRHCSPDSDNIHLSSSGMVKTGREGEWM